MRMFELLPRLLGSLFRKLTHFTCNLPPGVQQGHFGLQGIRERVNQFNGEMSIASETGKGARVTIALNMPDGEEVQA